MNRGYCVDAISGKDQDVDDKHPLLDENGEVMKNRDGEPQTWWTMKPFMVQIPYEDYVKVKKWIIMSCKSNGQCGDQIPSWDRTLETIDQKTIQQ